MPQTALDQETAQRRKVALALLMQGSSGEPIGSWTQGLNRIAQGLLGGYQSGQLNREAEDRRQQALADEAGDARALMGAPGLGGGTGTAPASPVAAALGDGGGMPGPSTVAPPQRMPDPGPPDIPQLHQQRGVIQGNLSDSPMLGMSVDGQPVQTAALGAGGPPPMSGMTPAGAIPVQTESFRPPAGPPPGPQVAQALGPPAGMPPQRTQMAIPPDMQDYIRRLLANKGTRAQGQALYGQFAKPPADPEYVKLNDETLFNKRTGQTLQTSQSPATITGPDGKPIQLQPGQDPKEARKLITEAAIKQMLPPGDEGATRLRKEVRDIPSVKAMAEVGPRYASMVEAAKRDNRAADLSLIYGLMKILDPTSVVRESEAAMAQQVATIPENFRAQVQSFLTGTGRLAPEVRTAIMQEVRGAADSYKQQFERDVAQYRDIAKRQRYQEADIIPGFGELPTFTAPAPVETKTLGDKKYYKKDGQWFPGSP